MCYFSKPEARTRCFIGVKGQPTVVCFYVCYNAIQGQMLTVSVATWVGWGAMFGPF